MKMVAHSQLDRELLKQFFIQQWHSPVMVVSSGVYNCDQLEGYAWVNPTGNIVGCITFEAAERFEVISLDSTIEGQGIGSMLLEKVEETANRQGYSKVQLVTTNDNLKAVSFYQKRGYRIVSILADAVQKARRRKPEIPKIASNGIPILDEWVLEKQLLDT
ncbi:GNAT family N-acetyltransferase [Halobacillus fulvus]|nr:GNAT family N-acetyltransferase [Halobacillus fulvus]